ncbi:MAG: WD40 repeat domain-containing protein [Sulfobacillus sp.]
MEFSETEISGTCRNFAIEGAVLIVLHTSLSDLDDDVLFQVANWLDNWSLVELSCSCRALHGICAEVLRHRKFWIATAKLVAELTHTTVTHCAFSPDGRFLSSVGMGADVRLWDLDSATEITFLDQGQCVYSNAFSPDGKLLSTGGHDGAVRLWDLSTCKRRLDSDFVEKLFPFEERSPPTDGGWHRLSAAAVCEHSVAAVHGGWVNCCAFSPDGRFLASAGNDCVVRLFDVRSRSCAVLSHPDRVTCCAFSPDGRRLVSAGSDGAVRLWEVSSGDCIGVLAGECGSVGCCAFSPDGRQLASAYEDGCVRLWEVPSGNCAVVFAHYGRANSCSFSPDGRTLAIASSVELRLYDAARPESKTRLLDGKNQFKTCCFSPDGRFLASTGGGKIHLWSRDELVGRHIRSDD